MDDVAEGRLSRGSRLRGLLDQDEIVVMPGVFDGFSARLAEAAGFAAALVTGAGISESRCGQPDVGLMGLQENLEACRMMAGCTDLLLIGDGDTGYGNAVNVFFTVRAFEDCGVAGVMLEDQVSPKRCGHMAGKDVISAEEMVYKVEAAVEARRDPTFIIKARTDAAGPLGLAEAISRANMYTDAGADLVFADALLSEEDIAEFAKETVGAVCINMGLGLRRRSTTPLVTPKRLKELGVAVVEYPRLLTAAAIQAEREALSVLRSSLNSDEVIIRDDLLVSFEEINDLMGLSSITEMEQRYKVRS